MNRLMPDHFLMIFIALVILASGGDLVADLVHGVNTGHLIQELLVLVLGIATLSWLGLDRRAQKREIRSLHDQLEEARNLSSRQPREMIAAKQQLAQVISQQFEQWKLTQSEGEVGQLLLKGFSLKEIALLRGTSEKTIRQQASSIYQKSGVSGRHAFSAWFLEDFL